MGIYCPRLTIIVTCRDKGFDDAVTLSWHSPASMEPYLYTIFLAKKRKSYEMINNSREFCVNFLTEDMKEIALFCGKHSGRDMDKFKEKKIEKEECESIDCPRIKDCSAYLECKVKDIVDVGDHFMIVGEITKTVEGNMKKKLIQSNITGGYTFSTTKD
jgi:flavin reductase (DIM6/NTAB) family NADH-FMN oxidoreductase RutF